MAKFRMGAMIAGVAVTLAAAGNAFAIESKADCEYEGGEVFNIPVSEAVVCIVPIRAEQFHGEEYDGEQLGVKDCTGDEIQGGEFCRITLVKGKTAKSKAEAEAEAEAAEEAPVDAKEEKKRRRRR